jgi:trehalose 6-phosphate phosphatase
MSPLPQTPPRERILALLRERPAQTAILCDIDGTLAPVAPRPEDARVPADASRTLEALSTRFAIVACISGRRAEEARRMVGLDSITYIGNHGLERLAPAAAHAELDPALEPLAARVRAFAQARFDDRLRAAGVRLEDKDAIWAFHWRGAPDPERARTLLEEVAAAARAAGLVPHWGRMVLEIRPTAAVDKGTAVAAALAGTRATAALYGGDDVTDLDAFRRLRELENGGALELSVCVGVSSPEGPPEIVAEADLTVAGPGEFRELLAQLAKPED